MLKTQITGAKYLSPQTNQMTNLNIAIPADSKDTEFGTSDILLAKDVVTYLNALDSDISKELDTQTDKINKINESIKQFIDHDLIKIVTELPTTDIDKNCIYLVPNKDGEGNNIFIEYIYVELKNAFEEVGRIQAKVDLSDYYTKEEIDNKKSIYMSDDINNSILLEPTNPQIMINGMHGDNIICDTGIDISSGRKIENRKILLNVDENASYEDDYNPIRMYLSNGGCESVITEDGFFNKTYDGFKSGLSSYGLAISDNDYMTSYLSESSLTFRTFNNSEMRMTIKPGYNKDYYMAIGSDEKFKLSRPIDNTEGGVISGIKSLTAFANPSATKVWATDGSTVDLTTKANTSDLDAKANKSDVLLKKSASGGYYIEANSNDLGQKAFAANDGCTASGNYSFAEGFNTVATELMTHAEGYGTVAMASSAHSEGQGTTASGSAAHAEGQGTTASGSYSHTEGEQTIADGYCSHAQGVYNVNDINTIHSVGIGRGNATRKNAEYIYAKNNTNSTSLVDDPKNGYKYLIGVGGYDGISTDNSTYKSVQEVIADLTDNTSAATTDKRGTVKVGKGLTVDADGTLSIDTSDNVMKEIYAYGIEWDVNVSNPACTRIGNMALHKSLPIQSLLKGCVVKKNAIQYYLDPNDWSKKADGTASKLDGTDGTVRVEVPEFYYWSEIDRDKRRVYISTKKCVSNAIKVPHMFIDAYKTTILNTTVTGKGFLDTLPANSAVSVKSDAPEVRGGSNRASLDNAANAVSTDLGKPRTAIAKSAMRTYARNAGSEVLCYEYYKVIFYWLPVIEYATFNMQTPVNATPTAEGYKQGGLGVGLTTIEYDKWGYINNCYPICKAGYTDSLGNFSGEKVLPLTYNGDLINPSTSMDTWAISSAVITATRSSNSINITNVLKNNVGSGSSFYALQEVWYKVYGDFVFTVSGLNGNTIYFYSGDALLTSATEDGDVTVTFPSTTNTPNIRFGTTGECNITISLKSANKHIEFTTTLYVCRYRGFDMYFGDHFTNLEGVVIAYNTDTKNSTVYTTTDPAEYTDTIGNKRMAGIECATQSYIKEFDLRETAEIIPASVQSSSSLYKCDYHWCIDNTALRTLLVGGNATNGADAGPGCFHSGTGVGTSFSYLGFRTYTLA